jgi:hypothetical protein
MRRIRRLERCDGLQFGAVFELIERWRNLEVICRDTWSLDQLRWVTMHFKKDLGTLKLTKYLKTQRLANLWPIKWTFSKSLSKAKIRIWSSCFCCVFNERPQYLRAWKRQAQCCDCAVWLRRIPPVMRAVQATTPTRYNGQRERCISASWSLKSGCRWRSRTTPGDLEANVRRITQESVKSCSRSILKANVYTSLIIMLSNLLHNNKALFHNHRSGC